MSTFVFLIAMVAGQAETLASLDYSSDHQAQDAWSAQYGTPDAMAYSGAAGHALQIDAPFASNPEIDRVVVDRDVKLDLRAPTAFTIDVHPSKPDVFGQASLYFHSGDGWYVAAAPITGSGWQTLRFEKSKFRMEDTPAGWEKVDRIRISVWNSRADDLARQDAAVLLRDLKSRWNSTAILLADQSQNEWKTSLNTADVMEEMLGELGVQVDRLNQSDVLDGKLGKRTLLILPYNQPGREVCRILNDFVAAGGKLFFGFVVPSQLQTATGFRGGTFYRPAGGKPQLATIRFDADDIPGLPETVQQASWNISTVQPFGRNARVIGIWEDESGRATGKSAMLISDRAVYFSHILLRDDWEGKKKMLASVLGKLDPNIWNEIVASGVERAERVGHFRTGDELAVALGSNLDSAGRNQLQQASTAFKQSQQLLVADKGYAASEAIRRCRQLRVDAYLKSQPSPNREARAIWEHRGTGPYPGDWDRTCRELADAGFNIVIPNMLWAGSAHYESDVLPRSRIYDEYGDQIEQCLDAARKHGLEVHVWKVNHNPGHLTSKEFIQQMRDAGRTQVDIRGEVTDWLNPAHPDNFQLEVDSMLEVVQKYDVDGIHFDYIRYPGNEFDYSDFSRNKFEGDTGLQVENWPHDCYEGRLHDQYRDWRAGNITRLVETISQQAREMKPGIKISAAVFGKYPECRETVGQEWPVWAQRGYVDFLCPMNYTENDDNFRARVQSQLKKVGAAQLYPGIGATSSQSTLSADRVVGQIHIARSLGAGGFTIFDLNEQTAANVLPGIHESATRTSATPPHRE